jgi:hypothetical protein
VWSESTQRDLAVEFCARSKCVKSEGSMKSYSYAHLVDVNSLVATRRFVYDGRDETSFSVLAAGLAKDWDSIALKFLIEASQLNGFAIKYGTPVRCYPSVYFVTTAQICNKWCGSRGVGVGTLYFSTTAC